MTMYKSSVMEGFCKKDFPINFAKFTGKHLHWGIFLN